MRETVLKNHLSFYEFRGVRQIIGLLEQRPDLSFSKENLLEIAAGRKTLLYWKSTT
ncbi:MAG: hypothetical protein Ct9H300mP28_32140 [Pseudomonadota bacterium]|nr:MAG: hypothetical protein Ct9H300mP28_32140 [Pseudomonadota bacterium]